MSEWMDEWINGASDARSLLLPPRLVVTYSINLSIYRAVHQTITFRSLLPSPFSGSSDEVDPLPVLLMGRPSSHESWFPGYSWTIASCRGCRNHLGWRYTLAGTMGEEEVEEQLDEIAVLYGDEDDDFEDDDEEEEEEEEVSYDGGTIVSTDSRNYFSVGDDEDLDDDDDDNEVSRTVGADGHGVAVLADEVPAAAETTGEAQRTRRTLPVEEFW